MLKKMKYLLATTAIITSLLTAERSFAEKVVSESSESTTVKTTVSTQQPTKTTKTATSWSTEEHNVPVTGARAINFIDFDLNGDNILSVNEIGKMLFKLYDTDGNNVIDNNEYKRRAVLTIMPIEKNTIISYDLDGDGKADTTQYTYETFLQDTLLTRFDKNRNGLSPREFVELSFSKADVNHDKAIDLQEWQGSYMPSIDKVNKEKARFNK